ncbi:transcriptional repressor LexA [Olsenella sp. YH-ols2217]|uniref:LexA repressor n=1 Tax=Kribbibacterium absianum TaxID=3044210 RepID=A0ABT6ZIU3_9ACTN|nr:MULTISPECIES: transcriptional repressor LexA [unclassified Olsenella]MDJ1121480.1 transcriptional repressor LexA [Olsenella sp. YH-ols2216]MDJ1128970.1 transcriptional repressor LexA [Olsenella sp. YH-ols2217]
MSQPKLSQRVQQIYDFLLSYSDEHGYPPSVREIGSAVGLKSPSTVHMHLRTLEEVGLIKRTANKSRTIEICGPGSHKRGSSQPQDGLAQVLQDLDGNVIGLPLVGRVAAGVPILAEQNIEETIPLPTSIVGDGSSFVLRVKGSSMINAGIMDGDYLVVAETNQAHNGEIVVALVGDGATVKTFYREANRVRLQPENDMMEPIYVDNPLILGRATALIRHIS